jgi:nitrite reductase/ring-hydroxylating ferredoxin subunit
MTRFFVGKTSDIPNGKIIHIMIDKKKDILVVNIGGNYYAVSNICSHEQLNFMKVYSQARNWYVHGMVQNEM